MIFKNTQVMMKIIKWLRDNLFLAGIGLIYLILLFWIPTLSIQGILNSGYYLKEMLMIMPVIFVLTALLDIWVPKETIMKILGKEAKLKGLFFSFVLGSISAGPIYAAFPLCAMLLNKGASIRNVIIILSSWAVVKIPMLLNEAKFLGIQFMALRWLLTVAAIVIFSWLTARLVKEEDIPKYMKAMKKGINVNYDSCMGCAICSRTYSELFKMVNKKPVIQEKTVINAEKIQTAIASCPVNAIEYH